MVIAYFVPAHLHLDNFEIQCLPYFIQVYDVADKINYDYLLVLPELKPTTPPPLIVYCHGMYKCLNFVLKAQQFMLCPPH